MRLVEEVGLRLGSTAASLILILALARSTGAEQFVASQVAVLVVGLIIMCTDLGLVLRTTLATTAGERRAIPAIAGTRLALAAFGTVIGCAASALLNDRVWSYVLTLAPYVLAQVARNHVFAQVRGGAGVRFELVVAPLANGVESSAAAVVAVATGSVQWCFLTLSLCAVVDSALVVARSRQREQTELGVGPPSLAVLNLAARHGLVPLGLGAAVKTLGLVVGSGPVTHALGDSSTVWLMSCVRSLDAVGAYATTRIIVVDHARVARDPMTTTTRSLRPVVAAYLVATTALPLVLTGSPPGAPDVLLGLALGALALVWFQVSRLVHIAHARRQGSPSWLLAVMHAHLLLLVLPAPPGTGTRLTLGLVPFLSATFALCSVRRRAHAISTVDPQAP